MSEAPTGGGQQPTEEELRAYLGQMRSAPVGQIVAEVASALLNGAQVKLGRADARLLIDLAAGVAETAGPHLPDPVRSQLGDALSQLRLAQVEAERELAQARASGQDVDEPNDLDATPGTEAPPAGRAGQAGSKQSTPESSAASRLWIPGR